MDCPSKYRTIPNHFICEFYTEALSARSYARPVLLPSAPRLVGVYPCLLHSKRISSKGNVRCIFLLFGESKDHGLTLE
eukprot:scaffold80_cov325-Pavlova_lutheri.AAC.34